MDSDTTTGTATKPVLEETAFGAKEAYDSVERAVMCAEGVSYPSARAEPLLRRT